MIPDLVERIKTFKEVSPGELAGPCPECGGALRLRVWPAKGEYACVSCTVKGSFGAPVGQVADLDLSSVTVHIKVARDGRTIHITDNPQEYARLVAAGCIVFDSQEMALVKKSGATPEQAAIFLDIKQTTPGARIEAITPPEEIAQPDAVRETGACYWTKKETP